MEMALALFIQDAVAILCVVCLYCISLFISSGWCYQCYLGAVLGMDGSLLICYLVKRHKQGRARLFGEL